MRNLNLVIKSVVLMQPTQNMINAGMTKPRWVVGVVGNFPRTDKPGQSTISIPEATMAIALQNNATIDSMELSEAIAYLATNRSWRQNLIGGTIGGVDFQHKGDKYQLTARSNDVKEGKANIGDTREVKNNMFIVDYDSLTLMANEKMLQLDRNSEAMLAASKHIGSYYSDMFTPNNAASDSAEPSTEDDDAQFEDADVVNPWGNTLESMIAYSDENGLTDELIGKQLTKSGSLMKGKSLDSLSATIEVLAAD